MKFLKASTVPFLHMAKQVLEKHTQWKVNARDRRYYGFLFPITILIMNFLLSARIEIIICTYGETWQSGPNGELPPEAGVIPRAVKQIFDTLESQNAEYSVKVTFIELYNEEITDLLAPEEISRVAMEDKQKKQLPLMEDGKGGVLVRGIEEEIVTSATEIFTLLERGSSKRRTAETLLNKQSR